ncbi:MAG: CRISPR-associated protein Cas4 [Lachnospiraceae bacterium]|nr:CRISPR-associated protein Cas4 [Lachnospiraceae bacterium]
MAYNEEDYLQLSGIQHFLFCRRQWALIHIENQWKENLRTTEGKILHERAHQEGTTESRGDMLIMRGLRVSSSRLGISGQCDVVEFHRDKLGVSIVNREGLWTVNPVEYKRGVPKVDQFDEAQLCAEAMCLEEMLNTDIPEGTLYYGETRRRIQIAFTEELRQIVISSFEEMHRLFERGYTPKAKTGKWCNACSLKEICLPVLMKQESVRSYVEKMLCENY